MAVCFCSFSFCFSSLNLPFECTLTSVGIIRVCDEDFYTNSSFLFGLLIYIQYPLHQSFFLCLVPLGIYNPCKHPVATILSQREIFLFELQSSEPQLTLNILLRTSEFHIFIMCFWMAAFSSPVVNFCVFTVVLDLNYFFGCCGFCGRYLCLLHVNVPWT